MKKPFPFWTVFLPGAIISPVISGILAALSFARIGREDLKSKAYVLTFVYFLLMATAIPFMDAAWGWSLSAFIYYGADIAVALAFAWWLHSVTRHGRRS
jgi:hypothetical protein